MKNTYNTKIGGPNHLMQIDETHFSIRKYNKGRKKKILVFFGAVDSQTKELRIKKIRKKTKEVLGRSIERFIYISSEIHSDKFSSYMSYFKNNTNFIHKFVNHQKNFVDPATKAHTQLIECVWSLLKRFLRKRDYRSKKALKYYIKEFEFRRINYDYKGFILFRSLLKLIFK